MVAAELHFVRTVSPWFPDPDTPQLHLKLPRGSPVPALTPGLSRAQGRPGFPAVAPDTAVLIGA